MYLKKIKNYFHYRINSFIKVIIKKHSDISGRVILTGLSNINKFDIDTHLLTDGIYFVAIYSQVGIVDEIKLVIVKK